tara:strand:- start:21866 stop:22093 length:228 start_codon:yes stop_codon:yes gene_type:complete
MHRTVLSVNILSLRKYQVRIGNVRYDIENIKNLGPQTSPISSYANFIPYQKQIPVGTENNTAERIGLSFHQSQTN